VGVTPERRAVLIGHIDAIAAKPWRGESAADQRAELTAFREALRRRGEAADAEVMRSLAKVQL
jgi:hypothetical protein